MTRLDEFKPAWLKIDRAKRHIDELNAETVRFLDTKPYRVVIEPDLNPAAQNWVVRIREHPPAYWSMIIGDAIHNLRASLDLAACGAVRVARGNIKDVHFPFASSCEKIDEQIKSKKIHRAGPNIMKFIRELKPYKGGNDILRSVHDLDIIDKHISIIPTTHLASITGDVIRDGKPAFVMRSITLGSIEDGQILMRLTPVDDLEPGTEIDASFEIAFAKEHPQSSKPILPWIKEAHQTISGIIRKMENICISDKQ